MTPRQYWQSLAPRTRTLVLFAGVAIECAAGAAGLAVATWRAPPHTVLGRVSAGVAHVAPGYHACPPRVVTYCVCAWPRDPWNERSRAAIGQAARTLNGASRLRFKEIYCNAPHYLPIFFLDRATHDREHPSAPFNDALLAHTSYPESTTHYIHVDNTYPWMQAADSLGRGYDLESIMVHEFLHAVGIEHDLASPGSLMRPYRYQQMLGQRDEERLRAIDERCVDDQREPIEVTSPGPGETWHSSTTHRVSWRSELPGPLVVFVYQEQHLIEVLSTNAVSAGSIDVYVGANWPLGPGYEVCAHSVDGRTTGCSDMFLVAP